MAGGISYSNCWEDADIFCNVFPEAEGRRLLSISSAGDNSLGLLTLNPSSVVSIDRNEAQTACTVLKKTAIKMLTYPEVLGFLGVAADPDRVHRYRLLRNHLPDSARRYWDDHIKLISAGINHIGKMENFFGAYRKFILPLIASKPTVSRLFEDREEQERVDFFQKKVYSKFGYSVFRFLFSRFVFGRFGRRPELYRYVDDYGVDQLIERIIYGLTRVPTHTNPYLRYITLGRYGDVLPLYLREDQFEVIKSRIDRVHVVTCGLNEFLESESGFHGFNLSDIFEYIDIDTYRDTMARILAASEEGARLMYWNFLVPRNAGMIGLAQIHRLSGLAKTLWETSTTFFYRSLTIEEVRR